MIYIGTAGWSIPKTYAHLFPKEGTHLERYAQVFNITEINKTFYQLPRASTLQKWSQSTPDHFRFSVKMHRSFTHIHKLRSTENLHDFIKHLQNLGNKWLALLIQLPPKLTFESEIAIPFFSTLRSIYQGHIALEARNETWLEAKEVLHQFDISLVAADPPRFEGNDKPLFYTDLIYYRLHGSPKIYYSKYDEKFLRNIADNIIRLEAKDTLVIFDNTASGAAIENAYELRQIITSLQSNIENYDEKK
ncbi:MULTISPECIES: DUF72 domain-containing protein [unclassified Nitratiruptor]|uniref:DUF72 domain-containing protein n=1 Tax=unclassified Nitratiruptor TaxID=2624044 RepID=UPI0019169701|nr:MULTISPECIES: DUF72 domain-containing protein [unclassified Nitratiruptor]BCD60334.1 hypothetical protein NitYY0810_C1099 [Nitratiruptor sp. YY08-10]BCD64177.1 hypothetical protein NitYY0814_C1022 [Nitratiruptor sp. YY08-14]